MNSPASSSAEIPRVAIIGVTGYAAIHLEVLREFQRAGRLSLVAATVINRDEVEEICQELVADGCQIYSNYREMLSSLAGRIDLCIIPTAPHWHAEMAVAALEAGCHVFLEKPLAPSLSDINLIQAAESRTGRWVCVGFQDLFSRQIRELKRRFEAKEWGRIRSVSAACFWPRSREYYSRNSWAGRLYFGGRPVLDSPISNAMAHFAMLGLHLLAPQGRGAAELSVSYADLRRAYPIESFDTFAIAGTTQNDVEFRFCGSHACASERVPEIVWQTDMARISWKHGDRIVIQPDSGSSEVILLPDYMFLRRQVVASALDRLAEPSAFICTTSAAAEHAKLYINLHNSFEIRDEAFENVRYIQRGDEHFASIRGVEHELLSRMDTSGVLADHCVGQQM